MERYKYDERNGLWYELQGDYYIPCLAVPESPQIGVWGQRHLRYIRNQKQSFYSALLLGDKLNDYISEIDKNAADMFDRLVAQMVVKEGITEQLKAQNQMEWVQRMNEIRNAAQEIVSSEVIFV